MAHILPSRELFTWCEHGTPNGRGCLFCDVPELALAKPVPSGWTCPSCGHSYAPWVPECHHCPVPEQRASDSSDSFSSLSAFPAPPPVDATAMSLMVPAEMTKPGHYRCARVGREWAEVWPGLQCRYGDRDAASSDLVFMEFRLTPGAMQP